MHIKGKKMHFYGDYVSQYLNYWMDWEDEWYEDYMDGEQSYPTGWPHFLTAEEIAAKKGYTPFSPC